MVPRRHLHLANLLSSLLVALIWLSGCAEFKPEAFTPSPESSAERWLQTRRFDNVTETELLVASVGVLQDLGFTVNSSNASLGFIRAVKNRETKVSNQVAVWQKINAQITIQPATGQGNRDYFVRVSFHRFTMQGIWMSAENLSDGELSDTIFEMLSKAMFLEAHKL